ncbi:hypothetical protein K7G91_000923 [Pasteurella canis]|uniref:hypothetical protein n=1 Tax=Pasteurella canis TaxID=753 RepID=UPI0006654899|nr:hypothetical protein [Pasteurella canis]UDW84636.1 hypothetical protein K7G91_000923 [Pasteurella canis]
MKEIDITIDRGDDEFIAFNAKNKCRPVNVTEAEFVMRIKPVDAKGDVIELSTNDASIKVVDNSVIVAHINNEKTSGMSSSLYEYSLRISHGGHVKTLVRGQISVRSGV